MHPINRRTALILGGGAALGATLGAGAAAAATSHFMVVATANIGRRNLAQRQPAIRTVRTITEVAPTRFVNEVLLQHRTNPQLRFVLQNTHYIAGARQGNARITRLWNEHFRIHQSMIVNWAQQGVPVIWTGDVNHGNMPKFLDREHRPFAAASTRSGGSRAREASTSKQAGPAPRTRMSTVTMPAMSLSGPEPDPSGQLTRRSRPHW